MKRTRVPLLLLPLLFAAGCTKSISEQASDLADKLCRCESEACIADAENDIRRWIVEVASADQEPSTDDRQGMEKALSRAANCNRESTHPSREP